MIVAGEALIDIVIDLSRFVWSATEPVAPTGPTRGSD